ncbi:MAG: hypothetical protein IPO92_16095 [Saprospiraceae bacterium]|nr:hypothetical protein [Saprospiraceae bacterium]
MFQTINIVISHILNKYVLTIFICLSLIMVVINHFFYIDDFIPAAQFAHFDLWQYSLKVIEDEGKNNWYNLYFTVDVLWAASVLILVFNMVTSFIVTERRKKYYTNTFISFITNKTTYALIFTATWVFDAMENLGYLVYQDEILAPKYLELVVGIKIGLYAFCVVLWLLVLYKKYVVPNSKNFKIFTKSASVSLLFLIVIAALLTQMEQGSSLVIALLSSPVNMFVVGMMLVILSIIFSHYPVYFLFYNFTEITCRPMHGLG